MVGFMNKKNIIILVVLAIIIVGAVVLSMFQKSQEVAIEQPDQLKQKPEVMVNEIDISNWQNYQNDDLGFKFNYPSNWGIDLKESLPSGGQLTLKEDVSEIQNITVRVHSDPQEELFELGTQATLGVSTAFGDYSCGFSVRGNFLLSDGARIVVFPHQPPLFQMTEENCYELFEKFDKNRILPTRSGSRVILSESEIPDQYTENYIFFKAIVDSFKNL